jgi:hypothetical protein
MKEKAMTAEEFGCNTIGQDFAGGQIMKAGKNPFILTALK